MNPVKILLPIDVTKWPVEVFSVANTFAKHPGVTVTLLHVVTLNIAAPEKGVYEALGREALWHLERLARKCLRPGVTAITRVRFGKPAEEILAEAVARNIDLIVLASKPPSFWSRFFAPLVPRVVERVIREATCGVFLTTAKKYFNCENIWGRPENDIGAMSDHLDGALKSKTSLALPTEDALALHANSTAPLPGRREGMALKMFWAYALQACATDQPAGLGCFSLVWRRYRRHLHRHIMNYNL